ncbi:MAG: DUF1353 domain-containing protein, partial [Planctomycetota bacterium]
MTLVTLLTAIAVWGGCNNGDRPVPPPDQGEWGAFSSEPVLKWTPDPHGSHHDMQLIADFAFVDRNGNEWWVPKGEHVDGASIPKELWSSIVGTPYIGAYRRATIVHDFHCNAESPPYDRYRKPPTLEAAVAVARDGAHSARRPDQRAGF